MRRRRRTDPENHVDLRTVVDIRTTYLRCGLGGHRGPWRRRTGDSDDNGNGNDNDDDNDGDDAPFFFFFVVGVQERYRHPYWKYRT